MNNDLELFDYQMNCLRDKKHQHKIYKLCDSYKKKRMDYMKECVIAQKLIPSNYKIKNEDIEFID
jgi:ribosomal protein S18